MTRSGFKIAAQGLVLLLEGFVFHEVAHQIEDGAVEDLLALLDGFVAQGLGQMRFADSGRAEEEDVFAFAEVIAGGQFEDLFAVDGRVELPVEVFERFERAKVGGLGAAGEHALVAHVEFILEDEFEELAWPRRPAAASCRRTSRVCRRPERRS